MATAPLAVRDWSMARASVLWTIGHSTRSFEELLTLLNAYGIQRLVDVRTVPRSRHNPQFNTDRLSTDLHDAGLAYRHMRRLGGLRKAKKDSINTGWRNASFRGYADYMQTEEFQEGLEELMQYGKGAHTAIMCAEAVPWRCHRSLIADALLVKGWTVRHILSSSKCDEHRLTSFAVIDDDTVIYPPASDPDRPLSLF
ncbi:MAG TPA: DUF488 domain-containing protein [Nitrospira sp.]|nr:DUF488 domain-containing protein [Nitrospira sp.]